MSRAVLPRKGGTLSATPEEAWEEDDCVRRTVVIPLVLADTEHFTAQLLDFR